VRLQHEANQQIVAVKFLILRPHHGTTSIANRIDFRIGIDLIYQVFMADLSRSFYMDLRRPPRNLQKLKLQLRTSTMEILVRLNVSGASHRNQDGTRLGGTHIHLYRQGEDDDWAYSLNPADFSNPGDPRTTFLEFCRYCHIDTMRLVGRVHV
jgi:hypothetical protein